MGNKFVYPSVGNVRDIKRLREYASIQLFQLIDVQSYWMASELFDRNNPDIGREQFQDLFGQLITDPDEHFMALRKGSMELEEREEFCDVWETLAALTFISQGTLRQKLLFLLGMGHPLTGRKYYTSVGIQNAMGTLVCSLHKLFNVPYMTRIQIDPFVDIVLANFVDNNPQLTRQDSLSPKERATIARFGTAESSSVLITFSDIVRLIEDNHAFTHLITSFTQLQPHLNTTSVKLAFLMPPSQPESRTEVRQKLLQFKREYELTFMKRSNNFIWRNDILSFVNDTWYNEIPAIGVEEAIFHFLESAILTSRDALPLVNQQPPQISTDVGSPAGSRTSFRNKAPGQLSILGSSSSSVGVVTPGGGLKPTPPSPLASPSPSKRRMSVAAQKASNANLLLSRLSKGGGTADKYEFMGIIDLYTVFCWMALNCPNSIIDKGVPILGDVPTAHHVHTQNMDGGQVGVEGGYFGGYRAPSVHTITIVQTAVKKLSHSRASNLTREWNIIGDAVAAGSVRSMLQDESFARKKILTKKDVLPFDQAIYNVLEFIASGHRNIPVSNSFTATKVSQVISISDVVAYLRENATEIMGKMAFLPLNKSCFIRKAVRLSMDWSLGLALHAMTENDVDAAVVVNSKFKAVGVLSTNFIKSFWWAYKQRCSMAYASRNIEDAMRDFTEGSYERFDVARKDYSLFSCLLSPLKDCSAVGIYLVDMNDFMSVKPRITTTSFSQLGGAGIGRASMSNRFGLTPLVLEDEEDEEAGGAEEPPEYSDTDSNSSNSDSDDSKKKKKKKKGKKGSPNRKPAAGSPGRKTSSMSPVKSEQQPSTPAGPRPPSGEPLPSPAKKSPVANRNLKGKPKKSVATAKKTELDPAEIWRNHRKTEWFKLIGAVTPEDNVVAAIEAMYHSKRNRAFVLSPDGTVLGVVTVADICREIIRMEGEGKMNYRISKG